MKKLEELLEWGGIKKDITLLVISGIALLFSIFEVIPQMPFDIAWVAIILCGVPIILEAVIGLVTAFDIKADVLVSLALIASICIHEDFAAGEVKIGAFEMKATKVGENSSIRRMIRLVQSADAGKARIVGLADRWATWIVVTALTVGVPKVVLAQSIVDVYSDEEIYAFAAGAEKKSEHPLGKAIIRCFKNDIGGEIADAGEFTMIPDQGVKADIKGRTVCAGNGKLMVKEKIQITERVKDLAKKQIEKGTSIIYVAVDGMLCGLLALADSLRDESADMIKRLGEIGIVPVLITGDNREAANQTSSIL